MSKLVFRKMGKICDAGMLSLDWYKKNSMVPVPFQLNDQVTRIFLTMCDADNVGRIGYLDVAANNPNTILDYSRRPIIDIGPDGTFDDNGVVTSALLNHAGKLYLFYSGYERCVKIPYRIFCGVAESMDNGRSFNKLSIAPLLPAINEEIYNRCAPLVTKMNEHFQLWYLGDYGEKWALDPTGKKLPVYSLKYLESENPLQWPHREGTLVFPFLDSDECGLTLPNIWQEDGLYKMIYSIRRISAGYQIGYAESEDGVHYERHDDAISFVGETGDWDKEMICFAKILHNAAGTFLFYSGNHYGMGGIGWAKLDQ